MVINYNKFNEIVKDHTLENKDEFFTMNALTGELGELANVIKKMEFHRYFKTYNERVEKEIQEGKRKPFQEMAIDEAGDTFFYFMQLLNKMNISIQDVMKYQTIKLMRQDKELGRVFIK